MPLVDHAECVLVVVDAQPRFYPAGALEEHDARAADAALERAAWLVAVAARLAVPTVVTEEDPARNGPTDARITGRLPAGTPRFDKATFALTGDGAIAEAIARTERPTVVLVGFETDVCVAHSAIGLLERGSRVVLVEDATFSPGEMHARGLARARRAGAELNHCKGLAYEWVRTVEASRRLIDADPVLAAAPFRL